MRVDSDSLSDVEERRGIYRIKVWARSLIDANMKGQVGVNVRRLNIQYYTYTVLSALELPKFTVNLDHF